MPIKQKYSPSVPYEIVFEEYMKDPEFRRAYEELEPEFELTRQLIDLRLKHNLTQTELARRVGVKQPSIARLEGRGQTRDLVFLGRVAKALDAKLEIRLVPIKAKAKIVSRQGRTRPTETRKRKLKV